MKVELSKDATKSARKAPFHVVSKLKAWIELVEIDGITKREGFQVSTMNRSRENCVERGP